MATPTRELYRETRRGGREIAKRTGGKKGVRVRVRVRRGGEGKERGEPEG